VTAAKPVRVRATRARARAARARAFLVAAKKACGCAVTMATAAAAAGLIDGGTAAAILGVTGVVSTGVVYWLDNEHD